MSRIHPRLLLKSISIITALLVLLIYGLFQAHEFIAGPTLTIVEPKNGSTIASTSPEVVLKGNAKNISFITLNGLQIFTDENGDFSRTLLLPQGLAIITVEAQDKFNRSVRKEIQLLVK
ncbi:MAG TPA: hypothetical protein VJH94_05245 [Candidatus Paceibacterota bacterium]